MYLKLQQSERIAPQILAVLRDAIVNLKLRPGEKLSENEIAAGFGVSRQPVREAFILLAQAGLVEVLPQRGTRVRKVSMAQVADARFVREAVECMIVQHAAQLAKPGQIERLHDFIALQRAAAASNDYDLFHTHDEGFHRAIAEIVHCAYASEINESARVQIDRVRRLSLPANSSMPELIKQHEAILARIAARDSRGAEEAMRCHLREILLALPQIARDHPDLFEEDALPEHAKYQSNSE